VALILNVQPPRWISATFPLVKPAKSPASQPGPGEAPVAVMCVVGAVASPDPEYVIVVNWSGGV
jgi:hypothetical protein